MFTTTKPTASVIDNNGYSPQSQSRKKRKPAKIKRSKQRWRSPYPTYYFEDHDPILDAIQTALEDNNESIAKVARRAHCSEATINNYKNKYVKTPRSTTAFAVLRACGWEIQFVSGAGHIFKKRSFNHAPRIK